MDSIEKIGIGVTSSLAIVGVKELDIPMIITAVTQLIVAIGTLYSLFKSKNQKNGKN